VTTELQAILVERIRAHGPMPFAAFMQLALYHPVHGYYRKGARTGRRGHFMTSAELDPAYAALMARGFERIWHGLDRPDEFHLIEIGPGEGGFARSVLSVVGGSFGQALRIDLIERSGPNRARQEQLLSGDPRVAWYPAMTEAPPVGAGCVFANEVLDNLPVHLVEEHDGELFEVCVTEEGGGLTTILLPPSSGELESFVARVDLPRGDGHRYEVTMAAESLVAHAARAVERGAIVFVDYGFESHRFADRPFGTLAAYDGSGADTDVLARPGERDITAHANWTAVKAALRRWDFDVDGPVAQREVLRALGAGELDERLRSSHESALEGSDGPAAVRALSRRHALRALLDPAGLGGLEVLVGSRGVSADVLITKGAGLETDPSSEPT
jgi:SAM-dependent MidA family methyltransferase